jgi:hypothetical protein
MEPSELSFFTTQELIQELTRRRTFLGVIVHSESELKHESWGDERTFKVNFNGNLDNARASRLLAAVSEYMSLFC